MVLGCGIPFLFKQPVDVLNTLCGRISIIKLFSLGNRLDKISAQMCEATTPLNAGEIVIPLIAVCFQIALKPF